MRYSAWGHNGHADMLIAGDELPPTLKAIEPQAVVIKAFDTESWEDACEQYHKWQDWEPYKRIEKQ